MTTADTTTLLEEARRILDQYRIALDKGALTPPNPQLVRDTVATINAVRDLADEAAESLIPYLGGIDTQEQWQLTGGWVLYDRDAPWTWPPGHTDLLIRRYDMERHGAMGRYRDQRRGVYEHGELRWKVRDYLPPAVYVPCGNRHHHAWKVAQ